MAKIKYTPVLHWGQSCWGQRGSKFSAHRRIFAQDCLNSAGAELAQRPKDVIWRESAPGRRDDQAYHRTAPSLSLCAHYACGIASSTVPPALIVFQGIEQAIWCPILASFLHHVWRMKPPNLLEHIAYRLWRTRRTVFLGTLSVTLGMLAALAFSGPISAYANIGDLASYTALGCAVICASVAVFPAATYEIFLYSIAAALVIAMEPFWWWLFDKETQRTIKALYLYGATSVGFGLVQFCLKAISQIIPSGRKRVHLQSRVRDAIAEELAARTQAAPHKQIFRTRFLAPNHEGWIPGEVNLLGHDPQTYAIVPQHHRFTQRVIAQDALSEEVDMRLDPFDIDCVTRVRMAQNGSDVLVDVETVFLGQNWELRLIAWLSDIEADSLRGENDWALGRPSPAICNLPQRSPTLTLWRPWGWFYGRFIQRKKPDIPDVFS